MEVKPVHISEGQYLSKAQAAVLLGTVHQTVQRWIDAGLLPSIHIEGMGHLINLKDIQAFQPPPMGRPRKQKERG